MVSFSYDSYVARDFLIELDEGTRKKRKDQNKWGMDMMKDKKWWQKIIVYELYPKSFKDTAGKGTGDLKGIIQKLPYLASLGIGAIWLTPVYPSPMVDNGYDISDYCGIHPDFGTMEDMEELIRLAAGHGIRIVMDLVFNHSSDQHPWFLESKMSRDNSKSDWYIWRDPKADGGPPSNWRAIFGGSCWTWCPERGQYFFHTFASQQPDLNWENPKVRKELYKAANFWVEKGVGGFRIDAITYIKKPPVFEDRQPDGEDGLASVHPIIANTEGILDFLHEFKEEVRDGHDIFTVGEACGVEADQLDQWVGQEGVFDMLFEFSHVNLDFQGDERWYAASSWPLTRLKKLLRDSQEATAQNGWYPIYFENHDKPRCINHYFPEGADPVLAAKAMGMVLYTLRGTPFLYQGQELGYTNPSWPSIDCYNDISSINQYQLALEEGVSPEEALEGVHRFSRDSARTPMQWDDSHEAGFTEGKPWLPVHEDYRTCNVDYETREPASVLSWYRDLARIRSRLEVLSEGSFSELMEDHEQVYAYERSWKDQKVFVLVNFSLKEAGYDPLLTDGARLVTSNYMSDSGLDEVEGKDEAFDSCPGRLRPLEARLYYWTVGQKG